MIVLAVSVILGLFTTIVLSIELGYRWGLRRWARVAPPARSLHSTMEASIFGLMGLLVAFIFNGAGVRFENRRRLVAEEVNAIGTAYRRLDLLPPPAQPQLRDDFRSYVRSRLHLFQFIPGTNERQVALAESGDLQNSIWKQAVGATLGGPPSTQTLVLTSINEVIDITTIQNTAREAHPPLAVFVMLGVMVIGSSALAGYAMAASGSRDWVYVIVFALLLGMSIYVILDYEFPRVGIIRIDPYDQMFHNLLAEMK